MKPALHKSGPRRVVETSEVVDHLDGHSVTYQRELIQCGKPKCKRWHGPYWYAYWRDGRRVRSLYIGKTFRLASVVLAERAERLIGTTVVAKPL